MHYVLSDIHGNNAAFDAILTMIDFAYEADAYFPDLEADPEWEVAEEGEEQTCFDIIYRFVTYRRKV